MDIIPLYGLKHDLPVGRYPINGMFVVVNDIYRANLDKIETSESPVVTAYLEYEQEKDSELYISCANKKNYDDVCLFLSFLTGRKVDWKPFVLGLDEIGLYLGEENSLNTLFPSSFSALSTGVRKNAFWCMTRYNYCQEYEQKAYYTSAALDAFSTELVSANKIGHSQVSVNDFKKAISNTIASIQALPSYPANKSDFDDMCATLSYRGLSAFMKSKYFVEQTVYNGKIALNQNQEDVLKLLNKVRNAIVHKCKLPDKQGLLKNKDDDWLISISVACSRTCYNICTLYVLKTLLSVQSPFISELEQMVDVFLSDRNIWGWKFLDYSYDDFQNAMKLVR